MAAAHRVQKVVSRPNKGNGVINDIYIMNQGLLEQFPTNARMRGWSLS